MSQVGVPTRVQPWEPWHRACLLSAANGYWPGTWVRACAAHSLVWPAVANNLHKHALTRDPPLLMSISAAYYTRFYGVSN